MLRRFSHAGVSARTRSWSRNGLPREPFLGKRRDCGRPDGRGEPGLAGHRRTTQKGPGPYVSAGQGPFSVVRGR